MKTLWFVVPAAGREELARVCLRQLRRTCDALCDAGIEASAVVIADDGNLDTAERLGFGTVQRENHFLSKKFNDGIQLACDPAYNARPVDYVVPCGSDDWVDHRLFLDLPAPNTILCFRRASFVREDGKVLYSCNIDYAGGGGVGIRVYPRNLIATGLERGHPWQPFRPADENRKRGCDTSILLNVTAASQPQIRYGDLHDYQVVDWKTRGEQLNGYREITARHRKGAKSTDPFEALTGVYPDDAIEEMRAHYETRPLVAA